MDKQNIFLLFYLYTNKKSKLVCMDLPKDDPTQRKPDITVAGRELNGWAPKISLREGLVPTIEYFKKTI